jgi:NAD(P)H-hydrate epimerase
MKVADSKQMREIDRQSIEECFIPSLVLMENAALRVTELLEKKFAPLASKQIAVVCGKGNNGGDGLAVARHLKNRFAARVTVWLLATEEELKNEALAQAKMAKASGLNLKVITALPKSDFDWPEFDLSGADLIIDAIFGTGMKGAVSGVPAKIIQKINSSGKPVVSIDIPSGLETDTGQAEGAVVQAHFTVSFVLPKYGLLVYPGAKYAGELTVAELGTPPSLIEKSDIQIFSTEQPEIAAWLPRRIEGRDVNKGTFGHVMVFAGSRGFAGAPTLVAESAARTGAGLVTVAVPDDLLKAVMSRVSPVVMTSGLAQAPGGTFSKAALEPALAFLEAKTVAAIGPGLGSGDEVAAFAREFISRCPVPLVIDADALNLLSQEPDHGLSLVKKRTAATILTPHPGEMSRLLGLTTKSVQNDRKNAALKIAQSYNCVVLLKGSRTLIATPEGQIYINTTGNAGMATGGMGDVLSGVIAGLLAQKLSPEKAAIAGAYIHGRAGELAATQQGGTTGVIATDLISMLPKAISQLQS